jgi:hypothetical protein
VKFCWSSKTTNIAVLQREREKGNNAPPVFCFFVMFQYFPSYVRNGFVAGHVEIVLSTLLHSLSLTCLKCLTKFLKKGLTNIHTSFVTHVINVATIEPYVKDRSVIIVKFPRVATISWCAL